MSQNKKEPESSPPIGQLPNDLASLSLTKPTKSTQDPATHNSFFDGGAQCYSLQEEIGLGAVSADASPKERIQALKDMPVVLTDTHIKGGKYSKPTDEVQNFLVKIPEYATGPLLEYEEWVQQQMFEKQREWDMEPKSMDTIRDRYKPMLTDKDGKGEFAATMRMFTKSVKIFVQSDEDPEVFAKDCTHMDIPKGARCGMVVELRGMRTKDKSFAPQTPIIRVVYVFSKSGAQASSAAFQGGFQIKYAEPPSAPKDEPAEDAPLDANDPDGPPEDWGDENGEPAEGAAAATAEGDAAAEDA